MNKNRFNLAANKTPEIGFRFSLEESNDTTVIDVFGSIGRDYWEEWVTGEESPNTAEAFRKKLDAVTTKNIRVNINSYGGDANDGIVIHDLLKEHEATVETYVYGFTASAGTVIAQAGDRRYMSENAMYLIHEAHLSIFGTFNVAGLNAVIKRLDPLNELVTNLYLRGEGANEAKIRELMAEEDGGGIFITADKTLEAGLIDEIFTPSGSDDSSDAENLEAASIGILESSTDGLPIELLTKNLETTIANLSAMSSNNPIPKEKISTLAKETRQRRLTVLKLKYNI